MFGYLKVLVSAACIAVAFGLVALAWIAAQILMVLCTRFLWLTASSAGPKPWPPGGNPSKYYD